MEKKIKSLEDKINPVNTVRNEHYEKVNKSVSDLSSKESDLEANNEKFTLLLDIFLANKDLFKVYPLLSKKIGRELNIDQKLIQNTNWLKLFLELSDKPRDIIINKQTRIKYEKFLDVFITLKDDIEYNISSIKQEIKLLIDSGDIQNNTNLFKEVQTYFNINKSQFDKLLGMIDNIDNFDYDIDIDDNGFMINGYKFLFFVSEKLKNIRVADRIYYEHERQISKIKSDLGNIINSDLHTGKIKNPIKIIDYLSSISKFFVLDYQEHIEIISNLDESYRANYNQLFASIKDQIFDLLRVLNSKPLSNLIKPFETTINFILLNTDFYKNKNFHKLVNKIGVIIGSILRPIQTAAIQGISKELDSELLRNMYQNELESFNMDSSISVNKIESIKNISFDGLNKYIKDLNTLLISFNNKNFLNNNNIKKELKFLFDKEPFTPILNKIKYFFEFLKKENIYTNLQLDEKYYDITKLFLDIQKGIETDNHSLIIKSLYDLSSLFTIISKWQKKVLTINENIENVISDFKSIDNKINDNTLSLKDLEPIRSSIEDIVNSKDMCPYTVVWDKIITTLKKGVPNIIFILEYHDINIINDIDKLKTPKEYSDTKKIVSVLKKLIESLETNWINDDRKAEIDYYKSLNKNIKYFDFYASNFISKDFQSLSKILFLDEKFYLDLQDILSENSYFLSNIFDQWELILDEIHQNDNNTLDQIINNTYKKYPDININLNQIKSFIFSLAKTKEKDIIKEKHHIRDLILNKLRENKISYIEKSISINPEYKNIFLKTLSYLENFLFKTANSKPLNSILDIIYNETKDTTLRKDLNLFIQNFNTENLSIKERIYKIQDFIDTIISIQEKNKEIVSENNILICHLGNILKAIKKRLPLYKKEIMSVQRIINDEQKLIDVPKEDLFEELVMFLIACLSQRPKLDIDDIKMWINSISFKELLFLAKGRSNPNIYEEDFCIYGEFEILINFLNQKDILTQYGNNSIVQEYKSNINSLVKEFKFLIDKKIDFIHKYYKEHGYSENWKNIMEAINLIDNIIFKEKTFSSRKKIKISDIFISILVLYKVLEDIKNLYNEIGIDAETKHKTEIKNDIDLNRTMLDIEKANIELFKEEEKINKNQVIITENVKNINQTMSIIASAYTEQFFLSSNNILPETLYGYSYYKLKNNPEYRRLDSIIKKNLNPEAFYNGEISIPINEIIKSIKPKTKVLIKKSIFNLFTKRISDKEIKESLNEYFATIKPYILSFFVRKFGHLPQGRNIEIDLATNIKTGKKEFNVRFSHLEVSPIDIIINSNEVSINNAQDNISFDIKEIEALFDIKNKTDKVGFFKRVKILEGGCKRVCIAEINNTYHYGKFAYHIKSIQIGDKVLKPGDKVTLQQSLGKNNIYEFLFEMYCYSLVKHKNIPGLIGKLEINSPNKNRTKSINENVFIIDYIDGEDLETITSNRELTYEEIRKYTEEMVDTISYLHGVGFVDLDIKPENIIIDKNNKLFMIDSVTSNPYFLELFNPEAKIATLLYSDPYLFTDEENPSLDYYSFGLTICSLFLRDSILYIAQEYLASHQFEKDYNRVKENIGKYNEDSSKLDKQKKDKLLDQIRNDINKYGLKFKRNKTAHDYKNNFNEISIIMDQLYEIHKECRIHALNVFCKIIDDILENDIEKMEYYNNFYRFGITFDPKSKEFKERLIKMIGNLYGFDNPDIDKIKGSINMKKIDYYKLTLQIHRVIPYLAKPLLRDKEKYRILRYIFQLISKEQTIRESGFKGLKRYFNLEKDDNL